MLDVRRGVTAGPRGGVASWAVFGVANRITLVRAVLAVVVAVLVVVDDRQLAAIVAMSSVGLVLDLVDGWVARRADAVTEFGARFDMEVDAFLILVLSVAAGRVFGWWVLAIGVARYAFGAAALALPWLRAAMPPSRWRKFVAAVQGVTLTIAVARVLPDVASQLVLAVALVLLAQSFGSQVGWLWAERARRRAPAHPSLARRALSRAATVLSFGVVWFVLLAPDHVSQWDAAAFVRIPVEGLVLVGLALVVPERARRAMSIAAGLVLALLLVVRVLDTGYYDILDRPFNPVTDHSTFGPAIGVLSDSIGLRWAMVVVAAAAAVAFAVLVLIPLCVLRVTAVAARHRPSAGRSVGILATAWVLAAAFGWHVSHDEPVASAGAAALTYDHVVAAGEAYEDGRNFAAALRSGKDAHADVPAGDVLNGLRGKDVLLVFVESYGQVAVQDSSFAAEDDALLRAGTAQLNAIGYGSRSAFLTSPTFGGISWLAHSTLQSGLWVNTQSRYDSLVSSNRYTLTSAFAKGGWRVVSDVPSDTKYWPEGASFYGYESMYDSTNVGYHGPRLGYARIPDQYTLANFRSLELSTANRKPVFAEIDLDSSHTPWAPLPQLVPWDEVGDGSVYAAQLRGQPTAAQVWQHSAQVQANYARSIRYTWSALISYLQTFRDPNLVLVVLGDHQPSKIVSGADPTHNVPISIISADTSVLRGIDSWNWRAGLLPDPAAPVWRMDTFRNRFLDAYSVQLPH